MWKIPRITKIQYIWYVPETNRDKGCRVWEVIDPSCTAVDIGVRVWFSFTKLIV